MDQPSKSSHSGHQLMIGGELLETADATADPVTA
jgi:hypothetical protein